MQGWRHTDRYRYRNNDGERDRVRDAAGAEERW